MNERQQQRFRRLLFFGILILGLFARLWLFGRVPEDINQDEAFAAYEAYSLLHYGKDSAGYAFPVYLTAWGSGMNALESYLMMPFIALFDLEIRAARLPQLITGCLSLWVLYLTVRRLRDERTALCAMFLLAICPWHVLLSRWGLESNLAPGFLLFGFYFFLRGLEDRRMLPLSALFYGLSLYAYATIWPIVPPVLLLQGVYCIRRGRLSVDASLLLSCLLLFILALPLLLFLAVNFGWLPEIRTAFFSIPKLLVMRSGEFSLKNISDNLKNLGLILLRQSDDLPWNTAGRFGLLYPLSLPFALMGLPVCLSRAIRDRRLFSPDTLLLLQLLGGLLLGALVHVNVNRVNILFLPLVVLTAEGLCWFCSLFRVRLLPLAAAAYLLCFVCFQVWYFTDYRQSIRSSFAYGLGEAMEAAQKTEGEIWLSGDVYYSDVLFFGREPTDEFLNTVRYRSYPAAYLQAESFGRFHIGLSGAPDPTACYILSPWTDLEPFTQAGFSLRRYGYYTLASVT